MTRKDFKKMGGWPNGFWGWGGEDEEMRRRISRNDLQLKVMKKAPKLGEKVWKCSPRVLPEAFMQNAKQKEEHMRAIQEGEREDGVRQTAKIAKILHIEALYGHFRSQVELRRTLED